MDFAQDGDAFLVDFGGECLLAGVAVTAMVETESVLDGTAITEGPSALLLTTDAAAAASGATFSGGGAAYIVRQVLREPPDGVFTRLVLARV